MSQAPSKSQLKKAAKAQRLAELKVERRAREKEAKKEKKRLRAEKRALGELDDDEQNNHPKKRPKLDSRFGGRVVIDLGFDDKMTDKEIISLTTQLAYVYSTNRKSGHQFEIFYTSLNGRTMTRLEGQNDAGYKRWGHTTWWTENYDQLWLQDPPLASQESVVYLTADSPDELEELKPEETYVIGGICDRNRYKDLCLNKAAESSIRTARLPIGRFVASLPTRKVLTVNQVFEIMLRWVETRSWEEAFYEIIPKRKFHSGGKHAKPKGEEGEEGVQEEEAENEPDHDKVEASS